MQPSNEVARHELTLVRNLMHFDEKLPTDACIRLNQEAYAREKGLGVPLEERQSE